MDKDYNKNNDNSFNILSSKNQEWLVQNINDYPKFYFDIFNFQKKEKSFPKEEDIIFCNNNNNLYEKFFIDNKFIYFYEREDENVENNSNNNISLNIKINRDISENKLKTENENKEENKEDNKEENKEEKKEENEEENEEINEEKSKIFEFRQNDEPNKEIYTKNQKLHFNIYKYRLDSYIKLFKTFFTQWMKNYINNLINKSKINKKIGGFLFSPNSLSFSANTNFSDNKKFLYFQIKDIFTYSKNDEKHFKKQEKNKKIIDKIMNINFIESKENENININKYLYEIKRFLLLSLEEAINIYYNKNNNEFNIFINLTKTKYFDSEFQKIQNFSLLEKNGFVRLIKKNQGYVKHDKIKKFSI